MKCKEISLCNFRNIKEANIKFDEGVNILSGQNAQGKTNLLEAIYFTSIGKSFRTQHDEDTIMFGQNKMHIDLKYEKQNVPYSIQVEYTQGKKKQIWINKGKLDSIGELLGNFRTVLFCPEHLSLVKDGPSERRKFLDIAISQLYPIYLISLQRYNKILKNRNQLLREASENNINKELIEIYSKQLAREAAIISKYRYDYIQKISKHIKQCFIEMKGNEEVPTTVYEGDKHQSLEDFGNYDKTLELYEDILTSRLEKEILAGTTLYGIHKDDISIMLNDKNARMFASQGQQRSLVLAMKIAEGEVCKEISGDKPVFLFDDVFSELDNTRKEYLSEKMKDRQVIISSCENIYNHNAKNIFVKDGEYTEKE